jgi:hypothetical protein
MVGYPYDIEKEQFVKEAFYEILVPANIPSEYSGVVARIFALTKIKKLPNCFIATGASSSSDHYMQHWETEENAGFVPVTWCKKVETPPKNPCYADSLDTWLKKCGPGQKIPKECLVITYNELESLWDAAQKALIRGH